MICVFLLFPIPIPIPNVPTAERWYVHNPTQAPTSNMDLFRIKNDHCSDFFLRLWKYDDLFFRILTQRLDYIV